MSKPYNGRRAPRVGLDNAQQVSQINEALRSCEGQIRTAADRLSSIRADEIEADRKLGLACQEEQEAGKGKKIAKVREGEEGRARGREGRARERVSLRLAASPHCHLMRQ